MPLPRTPGLVSALATLACLATAPAACSGLDPLSVSAAVADETAQSQTVLGTRVRVASVDLHDAKTRLDIGLPGGAERPSQPGAPRGDEAFDNMVARARPALAINGTFFSEDAGKRVMGDMVRAGQLVKFSPWEDGGTTFVLHAGNRPELITERAQGSPDRSTHWLSMTGGPRLVMDGKVYLHPREEGFKDPDVFHAATRTALGFSADGRKLMVVAFTQPVSLELEARAMKALGCHQAMNLDGGTSQAMAVGTRTVLSPGRKLTNILAIYDARHPAPGVLESAWKEFQAYHPTPHIEKARAPRAGDRWITKLAAGQTLPFAGLKFGAVAGQPVVGLVGGTLAFSEGSFGEIYAPLPKPRDHFAVDVEARVLDERMAVSLGPDMALEVRRAPPMGLFLRKNGQAIAKDTTYLPDRRWHRFRLVDEDGRWVVAVDGLRRPALTTAVGLPALGVGLSGRGEVRLLKVATLP